VLAVAEKQHASGKEMIAAAAASYETSLRAGWIVSLWPLFAPAGMAGCWGGAAATAKLMRFDAGLIQHALGIAEAHCVMPSRAKSFPKTMMTKEAEGWGAMTGVSAAFLAEAGFEGPETIFDLAQYSAEPLASLGTGWELLSLYFKPYPCCRFTHATVDGIDRLMRENKLTKGEITGVTLGVAKAPVKLFSNYRPQNIWQAQFSLPYVAAVKLNDGLVWLDQFTPERLNDPAVLAWADKVEVVGDDQADAFRPGGVATRITLKTADGRKLETFVDYPKGAPENPLSEKELETKFTGLVSRIWGGQVARELLDSFLNLEQLTDYAELAARLGSPPGK
jgi:2-methylcitrate dehydratase PrpD